ncbi:MAG TPA: type II toxin-antitoxin system HicA family toxin [Candidatus Hydrogenedentes bacterium]|nr:type II toxin-antitoxin system HicA family toxin [Candidatus Hydrogenedentota bacterium]
MRLPRDISGMELTHRLSRLGYRITRTTGSHQRLTTMLQGEHHVTVPLHSPLRMGTLAAILNEVSQHFDMSRQDLQEQLFD